MLMSRRQLIIAATTAMISVREASDAVAEETRFGAGSFKDELWVEQKRVFKNLRQVDVEFETAGAFDWVVADAKGKEIKTVRHKNPNGGWTSLDLPSLGLYGDYSIGFRNASSGEKKVKSGTVSHG